MDLHSFTHQSVCDKLTPDRDQEPFREWLLQSHSRFLTPESGFTCSSSSSSSLVSLPIFWKSLPTRLPIPNFPESGMKIWIDFSNFQTHSRISESHSWNSPETAPDPELSGSGVRNWDWLFKAAEAIPDSHSPSRSWFLLEGHSRFSQKIRNDQKIEFRTLMGSKIETCMIIKTLNFIKWTGLCFWIQIKTAVKSDFYFILIFIASNWYKNMIMALSKYCKFNWKASNN